MSFVIQILNFKSSESKKSLFGSELKEYTCTALNLKYIELFMTYEIFQMFKCSKWLKKYTQNTEDVEDVGDEPAVSVTKITISSSLDFVAKNLLFCILTFYARFPFSKNHITILISFFLRNINFRLFIYFELIFAACFRSSKNQKFQIQIFKKF